MSRYGYVRVSSKDQNVDRQVQALLECDISKEHLVIDKQSGKDFERRGYKRLIKKLKSGDELYLKSIDRLGRNYDEIIEQWQYLTKAKDIDIVVLDFPLLDTRNQINGITGKFIADIVLQVMSYVAQMERENTRQRQAEGIKIAKEKGIRFGRPKSVIPDDFETIFALWEKRCISKSEGARRLNTNRSTFTSWIERYKKM